MARRLNRKRKRRSGRQELSSAESLESRCLLDGSQLLVELISGEVPNNQPVDVLIPTDAAQVANDWTEATFTPSANWFSGSGTGVGFEDINSAGEVTVFSDSFSDSPIGDLTNVAADVGAWLVGDDPNVGTGSAASGGNAPRSTDIAPPSRWLRFDSSAETAEALFNDEVDRGGLTIEFDIHAFGTGSTTPRRNEFVVSSSSGDLIELELSINNNGAVAGQTVAREIFVNGAGTGVTGTPDIVWSHVTLSLHDDDWDLSWQAYDSSGGVTSGLTGPVTTLTELSYLGGAPNTVDSFSMTDDHDGNGNDGGDGFMFVSNVEATGLSSGDMTYADNQLIGTDVQTQMQGNNASAFVRLPFEVTSTDADNLTLDMLYDDGFVAYVNGTEVARRNAAGAVGQPLDFDSPATTDRSKQSVLVSESIDIRDHIGSLVTGTNVLAIQGLNSSPEDGEFLVLPELVAAFNPFEVAATEPVNAALVDVAPTEIIVEFSRDVDNATVDASDLTVDGFAASGVAMVDARRYAFTLTGDFGDGEHAVAIEAGRIAAANGQAIETYAGTFVVSSVGPIVRVTEFMADNEDTLVDGDGNSPDWIEMTNEGDFAVNLQGWYLTDSASNLTKWRFPSVVVPASGTLVVFASGQNTDTYLDAGGNLHTNFKLDANGDYLAFVLPDGETIVTEFGSTTKDFPKQYEDASYGPVAFADEPTLIAVSTPASFLVPNSTDNSLIGQDWTANSFNEGTAGEGPWTSLTTGVGFDLTPSQQIVAHSGANDPVTEGWQSLGNGRPREGAINDDLGQGIDAWGLDDSADSGVTPGSQDYQIIPDADVVDAAVTSGFTFSANIRIVEDGDAADSSAHLLFQAGNKSFEVQMGSAATGDLIVSGVTVANSGNGYHLVELVYDPVRDAADVLVDSQVVVSDVSPGGTGNNRVLWGDGTSGGTGHSHWRDVSFTVNGSSLGSEFATDVSDAMNGINSSAYLRIPFSVDTLDLATMTLNLKYDDGFVAYINGVQVAAANASGNPSFSSSATSGRTEGTIDVESFDVSAAIPNLTLGANNVLAIHGLNVALDDGDFLLVPELVAVETGTPAVGYMPNPTPNASNVGPVVNAGPTIANVTAEENDGIWVVRASVEENSAALGDVLLNYRRNYESEFQTLMHDDGMAPDLVANDGIFTAFIPATFVTPGEGDMLRWRVTADDVAGLNSREPAFVDPIAAEYFGTAISNSAIDTQLPAFQWWVENPNWYFQNGIQNARPIHKEFTSASVYYDGEFYDNVRVRTRGASAVFVGFPIQMFRFDFHKDQRFKYFDDEPRLDDINVNSMYVDESYIRNHLSMESFAAAGVPTSTSDMWSVYQNGQFMTVGNFIEQPNEQFLDRVDLDQDGALYKVFNNLNSSNPRPEWNPGVSPNSLVGVEKKTRLDEDNSDLAAFLAGIAQGNPDRGEYLFDNLDIPAVVSYMAASVIDNGIDVFTKNNYVYRDTEGSGEWLLIPWDRDAAWGWTRWRNPGEVVDYDFGKSHPFFGASEGGDEVFPIFDAVIETPELQQMFLRRLRTVMDDLLQSPSTPVEDLRLEARLDELLALMEDEVDASKALYGDLEAPTQSMREAIDAIKNDYLIGRRDYLYNTHSIDNVGGGGVVSVLVPEVTEADFFVPSDDSVTDWTNVAAPGNFAFWTTGATTGLGYEDTPAGYASLINTVVDPVETCADCAALYVRIPFEIPNQAALDGINANGLTLQMKYDDGFVAYLNGIQVARNGVTGTPPAYNTLATNHPDAQAVIFENFDISQFASELVVGQNMLAIQVNNQSLTSTDMLILPQLVEGVVSTGAAVGIPHAQTTNPTINLGTIEYNPNSGNQDEEFIELINPSNDAAVDISGWRIEGGVDFTFAPGTVIPASGSLFVSPNVSAFRAREMSPTGGEGRFVQGNYDGHISNFGETIELLAADGTLLDSATTPAVPTDNQLHLRVSEIHYNADGNDDTEFIEFVNVSDAVMLDLSGVTISDGPGSPFVFPAGTMLAPGQYVLSVRDAAAFAAAYPGVNPSLIVGEYTGALSNSGERVKLDDANGSTIFEIEYGTGDLWPEAADGAGSSLEIIDVASAARDQLGKHYQWRASREHGGTPGVDGMGPVGVIINEVLTNTDDSSDQPDAIELLNTTDALVDISGWYLSDSANDLLKFQIPAGTVLAAGVAVVFDENDFNPTPESPAPNHFALDGAGGDDVWLVSVDGGEQIEWIVDEAHFAAAELGQSLGRADDGLGRLYPQSRVTLGCGNRSVDVGRLVITEVNYNPGLPSADAQAIDPSIDASDLEFVEVYNPTLSTVDLSEWRMRGDVDLNFESGTLLPTGQAHVAVSFNPTTSTDRVAAFRAHYGINNTIQLIGGFSGQLSNGGGGTRLMEPLPPPTDDPATTPRALEDEVVYDDLPPWAATADGDGGSLQRTTVIGLGNIAASWTGALPSPGTVSFAGQSGDFDGNGAVDATDIDALLDAVARDSDVAAFDLDGSGSVDAGDGVFLVENVLGTFMGDTNLDGRVDAIDLNAVGIHWQQTGDCLRWSDGNFDGNQIVDAADLNFVGINWLKSVPAAAAVRTPLAPLHEAAKPMVETMANHEETLVRRRSTRLASVERREPSNTKILDSAYSVWELPARSIRRQWTEWLEFRRTPTADGPLVDQAIVDMPLGEDAV